MNKFLLVDFGASRIKSILYNKEDDSFSQPYEITSPLYNTDKLSKTVIKENVEKIVDSYNDLDAVVMCSILGGHYYGDTYYSWKCENINHSCVEGDNEACLLHDIYNDGEINGIKCYSSYGDTNCVIESRDIGLDEMLVNLGTGSQVISKKIFRFGTVYDTISFIPSGRALNVFDNFFKSILYQIGMTGISLFDKFKELTIEDLEKSSLEFDLNIFSKAHKFNGSGFIKNILEDNFTIDNFISSLFRSYINQYITIINEVNRDSSTTRKITKIYLSGGISKKHKLISEYITYKTGIETCINSDKYEDTHIGMRNMIRKGL